MKAVRFCLPSDKEEEGYEEIGGLNGGIDEEEGGYVETESRTGSQQHLAETDPGREMTNEEKTVSPILCGLCCSKAPAVSVWNCDGEILPFTEILCRYISGTVYVGFCVTSHPHTVIICQEN